MNAFIQKNKFILVLFAAIICLSCAYGLTVKLDPNVNAAPSDVSATDYSWTTMSQAAAQYLGQTASPDGTHGKDVKVTGDNRASIFFAGNFLGYLPPDADSKYTLASLESANTVAYSYSMLESLDDLMKPSGYGTEWRRSALSYAAFGYALTASGIDEPVIIGQTDDGLRNMVGPIVLVIFLLCISVPKFFEMVLAFLSVANPFKLFLGTDSVLRGIVPAIDTAAGAGFDAAGDATQRTAMQNAISTGLNTMADAITGLYNTLYDMSWAVILPIFLAVACFSWLVLRKNFGSAFKNFFIRAVFAGLGLPLLLACYSAAIDTVHDFCVKEGTGTPVAVIQSTFCNYGQWILGSSSYSNRYMVLPKDVTLSVKGIDLTSGAYSYDADGSTSDRKIVQAINNSVYQKDSAVNLQNDLTVDNLVKDDKALLNADSSNIEPDAVTPIINLIQSYTKGEYITAANYAAKINKRFAQNKQTWKENAINYNQSMRWEDFDPSRATALKFTLEDGPDGVVDYPDTEVKDFVQKRLITTGIAGEANIFCMPSIGFGLDRSGSLTGWLSKEPLSEPLGADWAKGKFVSNSSNDSLALSEMAAYNLLSSTFSDTAITVYSTKATSTNQVQLAHYAVSVAGQGYMELAYIFDACALMCCLMVLGYGYGFGLLFACFKSLIQFFPKVLTGMLGSLRGIAGSCALIAALIVEIIGTCVMYALGSMFIEGVYDIIETPLTVVLKTLAIPSSAATLITVVTSAVIIIKMTQLLLRYRKAVVTSASETATSLINKFIGTNVVAPNLESDMNAAGLVSTGLGLAMVASSTPAGSKLKDRAGDLKDKAMDTDAEKIATGAMEGTGLVGEHGEKYASAADAKNARTGLGNSMNGSSSTDNNSAGHTKTRNDAAADYIASNSEDFENAIGYTSGDGNNMKQDTSSFKPSLAGTRTYEDGSTDQFDEQGRLVASYNADGTPNTSKLVDTSAQSSDEMSTSGATTDVTGDTKSSSSKLVANDKSSGRVTDNSQEEVVGTKTTDVSGTSTDSTSASGTTTDVTGDTKSSSSKLVANDKSSGRVTDNSQEEVVGTKTTDVSGTSTDSADGTSGGSGNKLVMKDASGNQREVSLINAETGAAYTQADKDAGVNYDVVDSSGQSIYSNLQGGMSANTLAMKNGEATMMVGPGTGGTCAFGGGGMYTLEPTQAPVQSTVPNASVMPQASNPGSTNVTQNVSQNIDQSSMNHNTQSMQNNNTHNSNMQSMQNTGASNAMSMDRNAGSGVTVNVAANNVQSAASPAMMQGSGSQPTYVMNMRPSGDGSNANNSAPASSSASQQTVTSTVHTIERETVQTTGFRGNETSHNSAGSYGNAMQSMNSRRNADGGGPNVTNYTTNINNHNTTNNNTNNQEHNNTNVAGNRGLRLNGFSGNRRNRDR